MAKLLDLDAVAAESEFVIKLNGTEHKLKPATVETFVANMKELEKLGVSASVAEELEVTIGIILRAFPTVTEAEVRALTMQQIKAISDFARTANGEKTEVEGESAEGNAAAAS